MTELRPHHFGGLPRKELDEILQLTTHQLTQPQLSAQEAHNRVTSLMFTQTLRSLTLPDPQPTLMLAKRQLPEYPLNFRQLKEWKEATIVKYISHPVVTDDNTLLRQRAQILYLLHTLTFKE